MQFTLYSFFSWNLVWRLLRKSVEQLQIWLNRDKTIRRITWRPSMFRIVGSEICTTELQKTHCSASVALITLLPATYAHQPCKRIALLRFHGNFIYTNSPRYYIVPSLCSLLQMRFDASKRHLQCTLRTKHGSVETHLCVKGKVVLNSIQQSVEVLYILTYARRV